MAKIREDRRAPPAVPGIVADATGNAWLSSILHTLQIEGEHVRRAWLNSDPAMRESRSPPKLILDALERRLGDGRSIAMIQVDARDVGWSISGRRPSTWTRTNCPPPPSEMATPLLEGTPNFRDLGGLPTVDGRVTRHGVLFRSSALEELSSRDVRRLIDDIGVRTVIDLRSADDCETAEALRDTSIRYVNLPVSRGAPTTSLDRPMDADGRADMARIYGMYLEVSSASIREIFAELTSGATPAVFHCAAGKDRTGVVAAIVLSAVGVTRDAVVADFMETEPALDEIIAYLQRRPACADIVLRFPPGTMDVGANFMIDFLDDVERTYGGMYAWLTDTLEFPLSRLPGSKSCSSSRD